MTSLSLSIPSVGQPHATEDPKVGNDLTAIQMWANGSIDGSNVAATLTGRRLVAQASVFVGGGIAVGSYFVLADGAIIGSTASSGKAVMWWSLDPANYAVTGKSNTTALIRISVATNGVAPGSVTVGGNLGVVTFGGSGGLIAPTVGALQGGPSIALTTSMAGVAEQTFAFPAAGAYAAIVQISGATTAANSVVSALWQLFVLNS